MSQTALKYDTEVMDGGRVELSVPLPAGVHITVFVIEEAADPFNDLVSASESSLNFWNHPFDDEDWNNA